MTTSNPGPFSWLRFATIALMLGTLLALAGCATGPQRNRLDPMEPFNRGMFEFNEAIDAAFLKPVATLYREAVPSIVRTGISNFFGNLGDAWSAVNSLLQLKIANAAENFMRFSVNTFFGFGGLMDLATEFRIERHREDFGQTLGRWGIPAGPYLVLPFLGPSTLRDTVALPVDRKYSLIKQFDDGTLRHTLYTLDVLDERSNLLRAGEVLEGASLDKYTFTRDAYLQKRRADVLGELPDAGQIPPPLPADGQPPGAPAR